MFQSRVSGVGISVPTAEETRKESERVARLTPALQEYQRRMNAWNAGLAAAQSKCPPRDPNIRNIQATVCQPVVDYAKSNPRPIPPEGATKWDLMAAEMIPPGEYRIITPVPPRTPAPDSAPAPAKPAGSGFPLLLGAALLLLS